MADIIAPAYGDIITEQSGVAENQFFIWMQEITSAVNNLQPLVGSGSPEGVVTASVGRWYVDQDTAGTGIYLKESGDGSDGWALRS